MSTKTPPTTPSDGPEIDIEQAMAVIEKGQQLAGHFPSTEALDSARRILAGELSAKDAELELNHALALIMNEEHEEHEEPLIHRYTHREIQKGPDMSKSVRPLPIPFYVNDKLAGWRDETGFRHAGLGVPLEAWAGLEKNAGKVGDAIGELLVALHDRPSDNFNSIASALDEPGPYVELVMNLAEKAGLLEVQRPMLIAALNETGDAWAKLFAEEDAYFRRGAGR